MSGRIVRSGEEEAEILGKARVIAVVGASTRKGKPGHDIPEYLKRHGYRIIPVNPRAGEVLGEKAYPSLRDIPGEEASRIDLVLVFRPPSEAGSIMRDVLWLAEKYGGPRVVWFQPGTEDEEAARYGAEKGLVVVVGNCAWETHVGLASRARP